MTGSGFWVLGAGFAFWVLGSGFWFREPRTQNSTPHPQPGSLEEPSVAAVRLKTQTLVRC